MITTITNLNFSQIITLPNGESVTVAVDWVEVEAYQILGTSLVVFTVYEFSNPSEFRPWAHHSIKAASDHGAGRNGWLGKVTTRDLPAEIEAMRPGSPERIAAFSAWYQALEQASYKAIEQAYPVTAPNIVMGSGEGNLKCSSPAAAEKFAKEARA